MAVTPKGVRMVNENIVQPGHAFIITDPETAEWNHIPDGSLYINPETGVMQVKRTGESTWVPVDTWKDDTIVISRDTSLRIETFTVLTTDNGDGTFTYENSEGERRTKQKTAQGFVFQLDKGCYMPKRNHLTVILDDVLERSQATGGVIELDERRFMLTEDIPAGTELTVKYVQWVRIGNPYPRVFEVTPGDSAQVGDLWLDHTGDEEVIADFELDGLEDNTVEWVDILNKPNTVSGFGIRDASVIGHKHGTGDINGLENLIQTKINAIGNIDATTLQKLQPDKNCTGAANKIAVYNSSGKLPASVIPNNCLFQVGMIMDWYGKSNAAPIGWAICDGRTQNGIKTPDLRGKFVIGGGTSGTYIGSTRSNNTAAPVKSGGTATITIKKANLPPHEHNHTHPHKHTRGTMNIKGAIRQGPGSDEGASPGKITATGAFEARSTGGNGASGDTPTGAWDWDFDASRNWTGSTSEDKTAKTKDTNTDFTNTAISIIPPYVALFKIMYVGV